MPIPSSESLEEAECPPARPWITQPVQLPPSAKSRRYTAIAASSIVVALLAIGAYAYSTVQVTAQLTNASDGLTMWSEAYERENKDVFAVQNDITQAIVAALRPELAGGSGRTPTSSSAHRVELRVRAAAERSLQLDPTLAELGDKARAAAIRRELDALPHTTWMIHTARAYAYLATSDTARALSELETAYAQREIVAQMMPIVDRLFGPVRQGRGLTDRNGGRPSARPMVNS